jgi:hypothetical protein
MPELTQALSNSGESVALERIAITELADELQCRKQTLFKIAKRLGIQSTMRRDLDRRNQLVATVTPPEASRIRDEFIARVRTGTETETLVVEDGFFYIVQLEPDHDPGRVKVGFTSDVDGRLSKHRCSAPFAKYLRSWPCRRTWERAAIDSVTTGLEQLRTEVFRATSVDEVAKRGDRFFSVMPTLSLLPDNEIVEST